MTALTVQDLGFDPRDQEALDGIYVLDLPQLYTKPSAKLLLATLADLSSEPPSWETTPRNGTPQSGTPRLPLSGSSTPLHKTRKVKSEGLPRYLTKIISSPLTWIEDDDTKELVWEAASQRLSERSGRTAMGAFDRTFSVPLVGGESSSDSKPAPADISEVYFEIVLHEPALTADNLGLKTWAASYLLAKRMAALKNSIPLLAENAAILELGAGTGLVGIATAAIFSRHVILTDLPEILPNLQRNVARNSMALATYHARASTAILDWSTPDALHLDDYEILPAHTFPLIVAADVVYSPEQPRLFSCAVDHHLSREPNAHLVIELAVRDADGSSRLELRTRLHELGLEVRLEGEEFGLDDWSSSSDGEELAEVKCWWSVWSWR